MILKFLLTASLALSPLLALTALEVAQQTHDRDDGDNIVSNMKMTLIDKGGKKRIRELKTFSKDKGVDTLKVMFFLSPADVKVYFRYLIK